MPRMRWWPGSALNPAGELTTLPQTPKSAGEGDTPTPRTPPPRRLRRLISSVYPPLFLAIHHWTPCNLSVLLFGNIFHKIQKYGQSYRTNHYLLPPGLLYSVCAMCVCEGEAGVVSLHGLLVRHCPLLVHVYKTARWYSAC